jgi:EpsI family protein
LWKRLVLVGATIPIAIFANIVRIGGTGILAKYWGAQAAEGFFHGFSGWAVFMLSFVLFFVLNTLLGKLPGRPFEKETDPAARLAATAAAKVKQDLLHPMLVALVLILVTPPVVQWLGRVPPRPLQQPLDRFPLVFEGRYGKPQSMDAEMWDRVGGQSYFLADYHREGAMPIGFYAAFYEYQRKAGDFIHSPKLCLPGAGWFIESNHVRTIALPGDSAQGMRFNELLIRKGAETQLVFYWYQGRGRNLTNEFSAKFWMVWDGIWRRRTDGALVRLVMPLSRNYSQEAGRREMDHFAQAAYRTLNDFLP